MGAHRNSEGADARLFTVQLGYPTWYAITVTVEATSIAAACERAIEEGNSRDGWRSIDDCGSTFVERLAEGDDVDLWAAATPVQPVPAAYAEHREVEQLRTVLAGLLDWAATMGGWEAEVWRDAERALGRRAAP